ncbi:MAG: restriction endonuclease [Ruminococcaceae bacterium]|nr:restriction endonuclease [Oscillospiraceae bacterium]
MIELPFGSEFSPNQIELTKLLEICKCNEKNKTAIELEILNEFFSDHGNNSTSNQQKLAMNCRLGLKSYGIIDDMCQFTHLGEELYSCKDSPDDMYRIFAKHILLNLNGMGFVQCINDMQVSLQKVTLETLRPELEIRGITYPSGGKHPSIMRLWLEKAGVFAEKKWEINQDVLQAIMGSEDDMEILRSLTKQQRYFLLALLNTGSADFQPASQIARLANVTYGVVYPEKSLPKNILNALETVGYIEIEKTTSGRGSKSHRCKSTEKAKKEVLQPLMKQLEGQTDPKLTELLVKNIPEILEDIDSDNTYISGLALEALAFKLLRILGLDYMATRARAESTGGSEVDLLFHSARLVYSRWQIQCKNTSHVSLDQVAKEVGLTQMLYSNVIVVITTGKVSSEAKRYANHVMKNSNLNIVFIEKEDIAQIAGNPTTIVDIFGREAKATMQLKKLDL